ncbi:sigma-54-dependent transcriptional regulator [Desulfovibrio litoralis]|uniref:DNA-binding transcriptional response regulator, NtrC family, contains REC, AAA-type ATPase, and a Fis-type DNA-binding domains n=1 Tax=Desulfovibrio litoralis DSM 11393 TaxID=1121455 RepID=A0A1M7T6I0_9BACT|nr:sigma-54 dependent transcriptional regulator [Desulfovibrio litoralis]SHN66343.1 DNA-binding transcriptional response regulator, NtrC family, contains REC, AAA-type ATPase, and a Fis-type DNA-binding domains [Desulfovibrio litoralis DSM 11393]
MKILIVDDNEASLTSLKLVLSDLGHTIVAMDKPVEALAHATSEFYPLIITDIRMPEMDGLELLTALKEHPVSKDSDIVLMTGYADTETAIEALRRGAYNYLHKPINLQELMVVTEKVAEHQTLRFENKDLKQNMEQRVSEATASLRQEYAKIKSRLQAVEGIGDIIVASQAMKDIYDQTQVFHQNPSVPVLIEGETGTGKEIIARLIHYGQNGSTKPFIALNCSAMPHELFESELFGYETGAFTGSRVGGMVGKLELAEDGTLFLDEIAEMPLSLQPKLLRVLQERSFYRLGGVKKREFKARVICAGNRDMAKLVEKGTFRRDLYHRLRVGHIVLPSLKERPEDLFVLTNFFLERENKRKRKNFKGISQNARELISSYPWQGNIRELENAIERAVLLNDASLLEAEHLDFLENTQSEKQNKKQIDSNNDQILLNNKLELPETSFNLEAHINEIIQAALDKFEGNKSKAAAYLGISRYALMRKLQK